MKELHEAEPKKWSIRKLCQLLGVNRAWFYQQPKRAEEKGREYRQLVEAIEKIVLEFAGYGYRRVTKALHRLGYKINHKKVLKLMRTEGLLCRPRRRFKRTTDSNHPHPVYANPLKGKELSEPDQAWVADITYVALPKSFVYLAALVDAYSRKCVGWKISKRIDTELALGALEMAFSNREIKPGLIHHSDRGVQYCSTAYVEKLKSKGIEISMSRKATPYDNAKAESFFKTVKVEEVYLKDYQTVEEAEAHIGDFIEKVYNLKRLHSSLGYLSPVEFETLHREKLALELVC